MYRNNNSSLFWLLKNVVNAKIPPSENCKYYLEQSKYII
jgi:hypothetical protein